MKGVRFVVAAALVAGLGIALWWAMAQDRSAPAVESRSREAAPGEPFPSGAREEPARPPARRATSGTAGSERVRGAAGPYSEGAASAAGATETADRTRLLLDARLEDLDGMLARLRSEWGPQARESVLEAVEAWMAAGRIDAVRKAALLLLRCDDPDLALADLFDRSASALADASDRGERLGGLGYQIAALLRGADDDELSPELRGRLVHALVRLDRSGGSPERGRFVAAALGGARDETGHAARHLAAMTRESEDPQVRALAASELGKVAPMSAILDSHAPRLSFPPASPDDAVVSKGMVSGLLIAVERHPDEQSRVAPLFDRILRDWSADSSQEEVRSNLLVALMLHPIPELGPTLRALATDDSSSAAPLARKALRALDTLSR